MSAHAKLTGLIICTLALAPLAAEAAKEKEIAWKATYNKSGIQAQIEVKRSKGQIKKLIYTESLLGQVVSTWTSRDGLNWKGQNLSGSIQEGFGAMGPEQLASWGQAYSARGRPTKKLAFNVSLGTQFEGGPGVDQSLTIIFDARGKKILGQTRFMRNEPAACQKTEVLCGRGQGLDPSDFTFKGTEDRMGRIETYQGPSQITGVGTVSGHAIPYLRQLIQ